MATRGRRNRMIKGEDLTNRQEGPRLQTDTPGNPSKAYVIVNGSSGSEAGLHAEALAKRIAAAKSLQPVGKERHCLDCWTRGRNAAIRAIEGEDA